jgi:mannose-6-phosphate isomerase-like protein (cupin superfamily)
MALPPGEEIGVETHFTHDQFFRIEQGKGEVIIDGARQGIKDGDGLIVPAGAEHNLINTGDGPLRLYTIYAPPNHIDKLVEQTKAEADATQEAFDGVASE